MRLAVKNTFSFCLAAMVLISGRATYASGAENSQSNGTEFAIKLFNQETKGEPKNVLISPFSTYVALSMTLNGAAGKTLEQMATVLGTTAERVDQLNQQNADCLKTLEASEGVKLEIANAIYANQSAPLKESFIELCQSKYSAAAHTEEFSNPKTVTAINQWCSDKTHGKITEILNRLTRDDKIVLLNAIYFKGTWQKKFAEGATRDDHFTLLSGEQSPVKMMHQRLQTTYFKDSDFSAASLGYSGDKQRLYIFLPNPGVKMDAFEAEFTADNWKTWKRSFKTTDIALSLPRFKIEYKTDLKNSLQAMGMETAFTRAADFSKMLLDRASISHVYHKTFMEVNEEGTEAAAVTAVMVAARASVMRHDEPINFRVDRPFVVALVDEPTNQILFLGTIAKP